MTFQIYDGSRAEPGGNRHTTRIVLKIFEERGDQVPAVYMDNFYYLYRLAIELLKRNKYCTRVINKSRTGTPSDLVSTYRKWKDK